ncbi:hypothetical protein DY000_02021837 [Brassica cretica]|uniref:Uncharacterized protein n=1 Tax=Brassica cretica TaxID=69181 RepID=A0ABQ7E124_BRACR|nr:hypothetical protein DY000_02021837 [Brassica cretica]
MSGSITLYADVPDFSIKLLANSDQSSPWGERLILIKGTKKVLQAQLDPTQQRCPPLEHLLGREHITHNAKVLPEELTRSLSGREHITYNARYCLRTLHAYSQAGSILNTNAKVLYSNSEFVQGAIMGMRHKAGVGLHSLIKTLLLQTWKATKPGTWVITPTPAPSKPVPGVDLPRKAEYGPCKTKYSGFLRTLGLKITSGLLDQNPHVIKNLRVPMQSPGPEKISGPGKGRPSGSYITPGSKRPPGPEKPPGSKRPPGPKEISGFKTTSESRGTSGFQNDLRVQNDLWVQKKPPGLKRPLGLEELRVPRRPPGSKRHPGLEEPLGFPNDLRVQNDLWVQKKPSGSK